MFCPSAVPQVHMQRTHMHMHSVTALFLCAHIHIHTLDLQMEAALLEWVGAVENREEGNERKGEKITRDVISLFLNVSFVFFSLSVSLRIPSSLVTMVTACSPPPVCLPLYPAFALTRVSVTMAMALPIMIPVHSFFAFRISLYFLLDSERMHPSIHLCVAILLMVCRLCFSLN